MIGAAATTILGLVGMMILIIHAFSGENDGGGGRMAWFDRSLVSTGQSEYAEPLDSSSFLKMPFNALVNIGYVVVGVYWLLGPLRADGVYSERFSPSGQRVTNGGGSSGGRRRQKANGIPEDEHRPYLRWDARYLLTVFALFGVAYGPIQFGMKPLLARCL